MGPLSRLRVLDLADLRGALAGRILADLGADVLKVEPPGGAPDRLTPPFAGNVAAADRSLPFLFRNANKRGAVIDLESDAGRRRLAMLCGEADVLIENFGPAGEEKHDLTPTSVRERHPHLVHLALADFGLSGPRAHWRLEPLPAFASSVAHWGAGFLDRPPCWLPGYTAHDCASVVGLIGVLAALRQREGTGQGQTVEVSVQEAALNALYPWAVPLADYARIYPILPASPPRNADGAYLVLPTADGHVRLLPATLKQWRAFLELLGNPAALSGPEWEMPVMRLAATDVIRLIASEILSKRRRAEVVRDALRLRVPLAPVNTPEQFVAEEQTRVRGFFRNVDFPHLAGAPFAPLPVNFSASPATLRRPAPAPGDDDPRWRDSERHGSTAADASIATLPPPPVSADGAPVPPLAGIRVICLGVGVVVPNMGWLLGELGAEVIKIESRANLDFLRAVTIEPGAHDRAHTFNDDSRGQKSVCINAATPRGRELILQLCARSDVVAENNRGGVVAAWRLDYEDVRAVKPDVIYLCSQGFGRGGPMGEAPSFGPLNASFSGANLLWNHPDAPYPAGSSHAHPDHLTARLALVAVLAALEHRRRTGEGQRIEIAQTEVAAYLQGEFYLQEPCTGRPARPLGNALEHAVPHGVYRCAGDDRWCAIAVMNDADWRRFVACLGWDDNPGWTTASGRIAARAEIDRRVEEWTRARRAEEVAERLQAAGVSAMMLLSPDDCRADPHLLARDAIVTLEHPLVGSERHSANPLRMSAGGLRARGPAPLLGADTAQVLSETLGLSSGEIARLVDEKVCW